MGRRISLARFTKKDIVWMDNHRCKHGHRYTEHPNCYLLEQQPAQKIGFFDIETSNLKANFGIILSYCLKELDGDIISRVITKKELNKDLDKQVVTQCVKDIQKFDKIIGYYSTRFDIPFLRSRALIHNLDFPQYGELYHEDVYYMARSKLCIHSNRLGVVEEVLFGETRKTVIDQKHWVKALMGNKDALDYILDHNKRDVCSLEDVWKKLICFKAQSDRSV